MRQSVTLKKIVTLAAVCASIACATQSWATQFYIAPTGVDAAGKGLSSSSPAKTPQGLERYQTVKAGDTVWMANGSWTVDLLVSRGGTSTSPVTYKKVAGATPKVKGATFYVRAANVIVEDLTVENSVTRGIDLDSAPNCKIRRAHVYGAVSHGISVQRSANVLIEWCNIHNVKGMGIMLNVLDSDPNNKSPNIVVGPNEIHDTGSHGVYTETDTPLIAYNQISRVGQNVANVNNIHGIYSKSKNAWLHGNFISDSPTNGISIRSTGTVSSNTVWNNANAGIIFFNDGTSSPGSLLFKNNISFNNGKFQLMIAGEHKSSQWNVSILNNTLYGSRTAVYVDGYTGPLSIVNNILYVKGSSAGDRLIDVKSPMASYSERRNRHYYTGTNGDAYQWNGTKTFDEYKAAAAGGGLEATFGDPRFESTTAFNFHLKPDSTCLVGALASKAPFDDRDDRLRLTPTALGAYERVEP